MIFNMNYIETYVQSRHKATQRNQGAATTRAQKVLCCVSGLYS